MLQRKIDNLPMGGGSHEPTQGKNYDPELNQILERLENLEGDLNMVKQEYSRYF
jgi:hypothetical protein